jgi:uncharacterized protein (TIGR03437 family)
MRSGLFVFRICCIAFPPLVLAQVQLEFGLPTATNQSVLQLRNGTRLLVGSAPQASYSNSSTSRIVLSILGDQPGFGPDFGGSGGTVPLGAALDPGGNVWIAGYTYSDDFKLMNPIFAEKAPYEQTGFVAELDPTGRNLLFSTFLGAPRSLAGAFIKGTSVSALAIDGAGNVYAGGSTADKEFPTRGGIAGCRPGSGSFGDTTSCAFVVKIDPSWRLVYSSLVVSGGGCSGSQSGCIGRNHRSGTVNSMAVDAGGAVTMSGLLAGSYNTQSGYDPSTGYICRVAPDGSKLLWILSDASADKILVALDAAGNIDVFGRSSTPMAAYPPVYGPPVLFTAQVKSDGSGFTNRNVLGQLSTASAMGILPDKLGNLYLSGTSSSSEVPPPPPGVPRLGTDFILKIDRTGSQVQPILWLPHGVIAAPPSFNSAEALMLPGVGGALLTVPNDYYGLGPPAIVAFANSASYALNTGIFPGALLTLYGFNLPSAKEGLQVQVGQHPAPILYAGPNQINLQVPFKTPNIPYSSIPLTVSPGNLSVQVLYSQSVGIFTSDGVHAAAINQDGSVNSQANPATGGSVVSLFGTGAAWPSGTIDGAVPRDQAMLNPEINRFEAFSPYQTPLAILYAGAAPGVINGVFQINVLLPPSTFVRSPTYGIFLRCSAQPGPLSLGTTLMSNVVQVYAK